MSVHPTQGTPARRRTFTSYVALWLAAAGLAVGYLAFLGIYPDLIPSRAPDGQALNDQVAQTQRSLERAVADFEPVRQSVGEMKMEVGNLKTEVQAAGERDRMILEKVAALEETIAQPKVAQAPAAEASKASPPAPAKKVASAAKKATTKTASASAARAIETGSIKKEAPKPAPVGVLLATGPSLDNLRLNWSILSDRHADTVRDLHPRYVVSGKGDSRTYALVAGPVASATKAKELCTIMAAKGLACQVSVYRGNAL